MAAGALALPLRAVKAAESADASGLLDAHSTGRDILLRNGTVMSVDRDVGDFTRADVLIRGKRIMTVAPGIVAPDALAVEAHGTIVMPGFVDTHRHQYETALRGLVADGLLFPSKQAPLAYQSIVADQITPFFTPDDVYIAHLVASLTQVNAGVTTTVDTSQVNNSPEHTDAMMAGLAESGRRAVVAYSRGMGPRSEFPNDVVRVVKQYFGSTDQLLTLALGTSPNLALWNFARKLGLPIVSHVVGSTGPYGLQKIADAGLMKDDTEYIHCTELTDDLWDRIAQTGGRVSIAPAIEMQMAHGIPPFESVLVRGIPLGLSVDVETNMAADLFTVMRSAYTLQRALVNQRAIRSEQNLPPLLTVRDVIRLATVEGAKVARLDHVVGSLTPGKDADIVMLSTPQVNAFPVNNVPATVVTLMDTSNVEAVFIKGRVRKFGGKLVDVDVPRLDGLLTASRDGLLARSGFQRKEFETCCGAGYAVTD